MLIQNDFGPKKIWVRKILDTKKDLVKILFKLADTFHYIEIVANITGINVARTNVPKTIAN